MGKHRKTLSEKQKKPFALLCVGALAAVGICLGVWLLQGQSPRVLENPIQGIAKERSLMKLTSTKEVVTSVPEGLPSQASVAQKETEGKDSQEKTGQDSSETSDAKDRQEDGSLSSDAGEGDGRQDYQGEAGDAGSGAGQAGKDNTGQENSQKQKSKKLGEKGEEKNRYFTTSITDGETVTSREYAFTITHLDKTLAVKAVTVLVNADPFSYSGTIYLNAEKNTVKVQVRYEDEDGETIEVSKSYTIYLRIGVIKIYTDIQDQQTVTREDFAFTAYAMQEGEEVPLTVQVNAQTQNADGQKYQVRLQEGENRIDLKAQSQEKEASVSYTIYYEKPLTELTIDTDLCDQQVSSPNFSFYAKAYQGSSDALLQAFVGEEELSERENGNYSLSLQEGENKIRLVAQYGGDSYEESYAVTYVRQVNTGEGGEYNPNNPVITCELGEPGSQISSLSKKITFYLNAKDHNGNWIDQSRIQVTCNGLPVTLLYANANIISYELDLEEGYNTVMVRAWDEEGNETFYSYTVNYENQHGATIGEVTISVEATTIGSGYLVPETRVEITDGETAASAVARVLGEYGFTIEHTGTMESNFYLSRIRSESDFVLDNIPADLEEHLLAIEEKKQGTYFPGSYQGANSLGEFDFSAGSGWMYSVNGTYPNVGMSERILRPEDVIRVRYTLYYGADIGGAGSLGNNLDGEKGIQNWEKEW